MLNGLTKKTEQRKKWQTARRDGSDLLNVYYVHLKCFVVAFRLDDVHAVDPVCDDNRICCFFSLHIFLNIFSQNFFLIKNHLDSFVRSLAAPDGCELGTRSIFKKNKINFLIDKTKTLEASPKVMIKETILIFYPLLERSVCVVEKHLLN